MTMPSGLAVLRVAAAIIAVSALGGLGPGWLPGAALALAIALSPQVADAVRAATAAGMPGCRRFLRERWFEVSLSAVVVAAMAMRLAGIGIGLGHEPIDVDERRVGESVLGFLQSGELAHGTSEDHPGLQFWWLTAAGLLGYVRGLMSGLVHGIEDAPVEIFVGAGRVANVLLAAATVLVTGLIGRMVAGPAAGLLAAAIFAVSPLALETSTQLRNDVGMAWAVATCVYAALAVSARPSREGPWVIGALTGVAAGIKITAVFVLVPSLLAAVWAPGPRRRAQAMTIVLAAAAVALAVSNHFIWTDVPNFVRQIAMDYLHVQPGHFAYTASPRREYASLIATYGVGWPLALCAAGFTALALARGERRHWIFLSFPLAYLWFMTQKTALFTRWAYVVLPFVAVAGAAGLAFVVSSVATGLRRGASEGASLAGRLVSAAVAGALLAPLAWSASVAVSRRLTQPTYAIAETWLAGIAARGDRVVAEAGVLDLSKSGLDVVRVASLAETLQRDGAELRGARWVIAQEYQFGIPELRKLNLVKRVVADMGFGGNRGLDVRVYAPPPAAPRVE